MRFFYYLSKGSFGNVPLTGSIYIILEPPSPPTTQTWKRTPKFLIILMSIFSKAVGVKLEQLEKTHAGRGGEHAHTACATFRNMPCILVRAVLRSLQHPLTQVYSERRADRSPRGSSSLRGPLDHLPVTCQLGSIPARLCDHLKTTMVERFPHFLQ